jgi:predicted PurR-regulated permease PerM
VRWLFTYKKGDKHSPLNRGEDSGKHLIGEVDSDRQEVFMRTPLSRAVPVIVFSLVIAAGFLVLLWMLAYQLALIVLGVAIAAALSPIISRLQRIMPRFLAVLLIYLVIIMIFAAVLAMIIPPLVEQGEEIGKQVPTWLEQVENWAEQWRLIDEIPRLIEFLFEEIENIAVALVGVPVGIARAAFDIFIILIISVYSLLEGPKLGRFTRSLFPDEQADQVVDVIEKMLQAMGGFVRTVAVNAIIIGFLTYIGLLIIGVDYPLVLGIFAGMMEVIPYLGPIIAAIPILIVALFASPTTALIAFAFLIVLQQFESYVLLPYIMRTQTKVSPLAVIMALIIGGALGGLMGILVALPLIAALRVFTIEVLAPAIRDKTGRC